MRAEMGTDFFAGQNREVQDEIVGLYEQARCAQGELAASIEVLRQAVVLSERIGDPRVVDEIRSRPADSFEVRIDQVVRELRDR